MLKRGFGILLFSVMFMHLGVYAEAQEPENSVNQEVEVSDKTPEAASTDKIDGVSTGEKCEKTIDTNEKPEPGNFDSENTKKDLKEKSSNYENVPQVKTPAVSKKKYTPSVKLSASGYVYNGKTKTPKVVVKDRQGKKVSTAHYTVKYANGRKNVGRYAVTVSFKGDFTGKAIRYFKIVPNGSKLSGISKKNNSLTVRWVTQKKQISGYQVQYSTNKRFSSNTKTVTLKGSKSITKKLGRLRGNQRYYVRVRTYKNAKSQGKSIRLYSGWSKAKSAKTGYKMPSGKHVLTKRKGVNYYKGRRETWYSQRVLRGGGLKIPGRHVGEDGTIRDKNNYICISSSSHKKGTVLRTSLGLAKVYDTGCAKGTIDIYVDW